MEAIIFILNDLRYPKHSNVLKYLESMYMTDEILDFIDYVNLTMVNKALYDFVCKIGFKCFKICQEDYLLYKITVKHGCKTLLHIDDLKLCARFLQIFGYFYDGSVLIEKGERSPERICPKVKSLLKPGQKIAGYSITNDSPLDFTSENNIAKAKFLLINAAPQEILTDCMFRCNVYVDGESIIKYTLENSIHKYDINDLLKIANEHNKHDDVKYLLDKNPRLHETDENGIIPIMFCRNSDIFSTILEKMDLSVLYNGKNLLEYILDRDIRITEYNEKIMKIIIEQNCISQYCVSLFKKLLPKAFIGEKNVEILRSEMIKHQLNHRQALSR